MRKLLGRREGQAIVEMALASMLFIFAFFAAMEFARALYSYNTIVHFARMAARYAVVNQTDSASLDRAKNIAVYGNPDVSSGSPVLPGLTRDMVSVNLQTLESDINGQPVNQKISVVVSGYQFQFVVPIYNSITIPAFETSLYTESLGNVPP